MCQERIDERNCIDFPLPLKGTFTPVFGGILPLYSERSHRLKQPRFLDQRLICWKPCSLVICSRSVPPPRTLVHKFGYISSFRLVSYGHFERSEKSQTDMIKKQISPFGRYDTVGGRYDTVGVDMTRLVDMTWKIYWHRLCIDCPEISSSEG
jgi:hypothetical protein